MLILPYSVKFIDLFPANTSSSKGVIGDKPNSKWRPPPCWIYYHRQFWSHGLFPVVTGYICAKLHESTSIGCWVITFCAKIQDGGWCNLGFFLFSIMVFPYVGS